MGKINHTVFMLKAKNLGIAVGQRMDSIDSSESISFSYIDLEEFFLEATYSIDQSRLAEGFLCWLLQFGHLLAPSKIRKLITENTTYSSPFLGCYVQWMMDHGIQKHQWKILFPWMKKAKEKKTWVSGPAPLNPNSSFLKYNILAHDYQLNKEKFLLPTKQIFLQSLELKNRALYGSSVNADVASFLARNSESTAYEVAKKTHHHRARVYSVYQDIKIALSV